MSAATKRKQEQRAKRAALGIKRVEVALSERERQQLDHLRIARAGSGEPYSAALLHNSKAGQQSLRRRFRSVDLLSYRHT